MAELLKGAPVAAKLTEELAARAEKLQEIGIEPALAVIRVGENPSDIAYENGLLKRMEKVGIRTELVHLPANCSREELLTEIRKINEAPDIDGCLMFRPLSDKKMEAAACELLDPKKDVDAMTAGSMAGVFAGTGIGYPPCTAQAVMEILDHYGIDPEGKKVTVVGRSLVIGKPVAMLLLQKNATVTMCHTKTMDLPEETKRAEILIAAAGKAEMLDETYLSEGQIVIDVGINMMENGRLVGDVYFERAEDLAAAITPVPGGVGSVTTAVLAKHVIEAAERQA